MYLAHQMGGPQGARVGGAGGRCSWLPRSGALELRQFARAISLAVAPDMAESE